MPSGHGSALRVSATPYLTQKMRERRMCLVFNRRVSASFAQEVNEAGGRLRRIGNGNKGWLVPPERWEDVHELMMGHELWGCADAIRKCIDGIQLVQQVHMVE